jgi:hypothetical protein
MFFRRCSRLVAPAVVEMIEQKPYHGGWTLYVAKIMKYFRLSREGRGYSKRKAVWDDYSILMKNRDIMGGMNGYGWTKVIASL